jgi:hypothetical protein
MIEPRATWLFIPLAGAAVMALGHLWGSSSSATARPSDSVVVSEKQETQAPRATPKTRARARAVASGPRTVSAVAAASADAAGADSLDTADMPAEFELEPEDEEILAEEARIKHFDELSRRIEAEVVDGAWRHQTEAPLKRLLSQHLGPQIMVAEATCASSFCRVKLTHPDLPRLPTSGIFEFDVARASLEVTEVQYDNRQPGLTTLYFKRGPAPATQPALADAT